MSVGPFTEGLTLDWLWSEASIKLSVSPHLWGYIYSFTSHYFRFKYNLFSLDIYTESWLYNIVKAFQSRPLSMPSGLLRRSITSSAVSWLKNRDCTSPLWYHFLFSSSPLCLLPLPLCKVFFPIIKKKNCGQEERNKILCKCYWWESNLKSLNHRYRNSATAPNWLSRIY